MRPVAPDTCQDATVSPPSAMARASTKAALRWSPEKGSSRQQEPALALGVVGRRAGETVGVPALPIRAQDGDYQPTVAGDGGHTGDA